MTKTRSRCNVVVLAFLLVMGLALGGGCAGIGSAELETFVKGLLLNAAAALLS